MLHIQRKQFSLRQAKFYASEVLLALEYFHQNGIIYRYGLTHSRDYKRNLLKIPRIFLAISSWTISC